MDQFLMARRLVEAGVRCVTLSFGSWDRHGANFSRLPIQLPKLDQGVTALVQERQFALLESMAEAVAARLLEEMPRVQTVRLEIRKPQAVPAAAGAFVWVERTRV
jgi:hypothetical protein